MTDATTDRVAIGCPVPVLDGPYKMDCGRTVVDGLCGRHGRVVCERCGEIPAFCQWADYERRDRPPGCLNKSAVPDA